MLHSDFQRQLNHCHVSKKKVEDVDLIYFLGFLMSILTSKAAGKLASTQFSRYQTLLACQNRSPCFSRRRLHI